MTPDTDVTPAYITEFMKSNARYFPDSYVICTNHTDLNNISSFLLDVKDFNHNPCHYYEFCSCPEMRSQPDIAGIGVLVAFSTAAFLTLCLSIFCLIVGRTNEERQTFNPVDRFMRKYMSEPLRHFMRRMGSSPDLQSLIAHDLVNTFSDLQLVTGLAILVAGVKELADGTISVYHFLIITDLAWFCTNSHLLSLAVTRRMRDSVKRTHPHRYNREQTELAARLARASRILLMASTFVLLVFAFWATGFGKAYVEEVLNCPIQCTMKEARGGTPELLMVINMVLMGYFYAVQTFLTWRTGRIFWMDHIRALLIDKQGQSVNVLNPAIVFKRWTESKLLEMLKKLFVAMWYFFASETGNLLGLTVYFGFGVWSLKHDRKIAHKLLGKATEAEDEMVFSQLVPIFLIIIPFMGLFESYARHSVAIKESEAKEVGSCTSEGS
ncbi:uncharacterized protein CCOS01_12195 [Colletotrichum costaricense]|uniref:Uncharacterized protein n=1 Tax=Colletotrichum costaricense TaxID=1209916 RepID=A0AAI9YPM9_9PEZI|nr:uncharacterized protein CCOS01_12195 [Colletotrichum costaricense]KAK1517938.1 hypothetical protein CCOS01_12195 [Colletotrichum costaricense]